MSLDQDAELVSLASGKTWEVFSTKVFSGGDRALSTLPPGKTTLLRLVFECKRAGTGRT